MAHLDIVTAIIIAALLIYAIVKQFMAKPVKKFGFVLFPLLALYEAYETYPQAPLPSSQIVECLIMVTLALASAVIQGVNTEVFYRNDQLYMRSKLVAIITWVIYFAVRIGLKFLFDSKGSFMTWLGMAVIFGARSVVLFIWHPEIGQALSQSSGRSRRRY